MYLEINDNLDLQDYLNSFLKEALKRNLIEEKNIELIYIQIKDLFIKQATKFTLGDSSSIPEETANDILSSISYTIGIELQSINDFNKRLEILLSTPIESIFSIGLEKTKNMFKKAKLYYLQTKKHMLRINVVCYNDTLIHGIETFFQKYDCDFYSHCTPGSIDYPLAYDKMDTIGIQYLFIYLKRVYLENLLCKRIKHSTLLTLLNNYDRNYGVLLFNIFKVILHNLIGCIIINKNPHSILLTKNECNSIYKRLSFYNELDYENLHKKITDLILSEDLVEDTFSKEYVHSIVFDTLESLKVYIKYKDKYPFFTYNHDKLQDKLKFIDNKSLDDDTFREYLEEILSLRYTEDKIGMLNECCKSIKDLIDFLNNDIFYSKEYNTYFSTLSVNNISLLLSRSLLYGIPIKDDFINQLISLPKTFKWETELIKYIQTINNSNIDLIKNTLFSLEDIT